MKKLFRSHKKAERKLCVSQIAQGLTDIRMKKKSIVIKLFRTYLTWIMVCIFVILCGTLLYVGNVVNASRTETQRQLTLSINQNIENYFQKMDDFSMELIKTEEFQEIVQNSLPKAYEAGENTGYLFSRLYLDAYKMIQQKYKVGIITDDNHYIWMGDEYFIDKIQEDVPDIYQEYERHGGAVVKYMDRNAYLNASMGKRTVTEKDISVVTLSRSFGNEGWWYNGADILEVQVNAEDFAAAIRKLSSTKEGTGLQIHVLNAEGETIFSETDWNGRTFLEENGWSTGLFRENGYYTYVYQIFDSQLYVLYQISLFDYYHHFFKFMGTALLLFLALAVIMTAVSYHISRTFSKPIHELCDELGKIDLEKGRHYQPVDTDIFELEYLSEAIGELTVKLEESMHHVVMLKEFEMQSKMLALQAQMQPHFLVNTLTTMGSMAEQTGNQNISRMCLNLTQMFRYISAEGSGGVPLYEEIKHVNRYVDIMKERFPNAGVEIDIPLEMMNIRIPKLVIQPLVENSFKYCNRSHPYIRVVGSMAEDGHWRIKVSDNGEGISEERAEEILHKCRKSIEGVNSLSTKIDGMGLVNVYVRLHLFYRKDVVFDIGKDGIEIGGKVPE